MGRGAKIRSNEIQNRLDEGKRNSDAKEKRSDGHVGATGLGTEKAEAVSETGNASCGRTNNSKS